MHRRSTLLALASGALLHGAPAFAQSAAPTTVVVPFPAGGTLDILARLLTQKLNELTKEAYVVDNRPGANGMVGSKAAAKARADGRTWLMADSAPVTINPFLYPADPSFSAEKDLRPIRALAFQPLVLVVKSDAPAKSAKEFIDMAKKEELTYASGGIGSTGHLAMAYFGNAAGGLKLRHIPYRGGPQVLMSLVTGETNSGFIVVPNVLQAIKRGELRALGVSSAQRYPLLPDVPTMAELGLRNFEVENRYFAWLPSGVPEDVAKRMDGLLQTALADPALLERMRNAGLDPLTDMGEAASRSWMQANRATWQKVIQDNGIKAE